MERLYTILFVWLSITLLFLPSNVSAFKLPNFRNKSDCDESMPPPLKFNVQCRCGKVKAAIQCLEAAPPLRLVCYCKDCRGYYSALNRMAIKGGNPPAATLDAWGGVDWTVLYPRDITITHGSDLLVTTKIRESSPVRQVYTSCCQTPMFRFGEMSVLMNTDTIVSSDKGEQLKPDIRFRIMGRQALAREDKPKDTSRSVPLSWFWVMCGRIKKDLMNPMPIDLKPKEAVQVLEEFKEE